MTNRTKTYLAGDWTGDRDLIDKLHDWNKSDHYGLHFVDVHNYMTSYDTSYPCSIKASLKERLSVSKTFVLVVGSDTNSLTKGSCRYCKRYSSYFGSCNNDYSLDFRSFIQYECEMAVKSYNEGEIKKIVVIYNYANVKKEKCPEVIRYKGIHIPGYFYGNDGKEYWNYLEIKKAINE